jgi:hypothetical protein
VAIKLTHLQLHWGLAGAREKFEDMVAQLIHVERPDSQRVRVVKGDAGLDSFDDSLSDLNGIDVFQVKFFPDGIEKSQKNQIRDSFATARDSKKFKVKSWTLCLPIDMSTDETEWFEGWAKTQVSTGITINKPWGALHIEGLLLLDKNQAIRQAFFREENPELLRVQAASLERILQELVRQGTPGVLKMTLDGVKPRGAHRWTEDQVVVEVQFCYRLENIGSRFVPKWSTGGELHLQDDALGKRFVNKEEFPRIGSGDNTYIRWDSTILPTTSLTTEHFVGIIVRRSEKFDETLPRILNATSVTFWPITEEGPGEKTTVKLSDELDWGKLLPSFQQAYMLGLGRLSAE